MRQLTYCFAPSTPPKCRVKSLRRLKMSRVRLSAVAAAALLLGVIPAHAAWKEYVYEDLGIAKYFPVEPKMGKGTWGEGIRLPLSKIVPDTTLTAQDAGVTYKVTVVDFSSRGAEGANIMGEAISSLAAKGTVASWGFPRLDLGTNSVYGLALVVDEKAGNHTSSAVFFNKGKLYLVQAIAPKDGPARFDAGIGRFLETVRFYLKGYGYDEKIGHDFPIGDDDPGDRDLGNNRPPR
jgi:hypothetical protein